MSAADRLRRIADAAPAALGDDGAWLAAAIGRFLTEAPAGVSLEAAIGLHAGWWREEARAERDRALRDLARALLPDGDLSGREAAVRAELRRFERRWQRVDRHRAMPAEYSGRIERHLYRAFVAAAQIGSDVPLGRTTLREILSRSGSEETQTLAKLFRATA